MSLSIQHVSDTAFLVAEYRALESARADALFSDPLAARLSGERGRALAARFARNPMSGWSVALRTRLIDELLLRAIAGGVDTVLNLGAGLDTRPWRLALPATLRWIEVDYPHVLALKTERLADQAPRCRLDTVPLDLADGPARRAFFTGLAAQGGRALLLTEGVVPYLTVEAAGELAEDLRAVPALETWIVDRISSEVLRHRQRSGVSSQMAQAPFRFDPPDWAAFFAQHGWREREAHSLFTEGRRLGRPPPFPMLQRLAMAVGRWLAPPARRGAMDQSMAYVVLERTPGA